MTEFSSDQPSAPARRRLKVHSDSGEAAYSRARRGSRRVSWLRFALPALALLGVAAFAAFYALMPKDVGVSMSGLNLDAKSLTIEKPRFSGFKGTARSYEISAARAVQDLANPKIVRLEEIAGSLGVEAGNATLSAKAGVYDSTAQTLTLADGVSVKTSEGIAISLGEATVDFDKKTLVSTSPLAITSALGEVRANAVRIDQGARTVRFEKGVKVSYTPRAGDGIAAGAAAPAESQ